MKKINFTSKVIQYPGTGGWYFAYVDNSQSKKLRELPSAKKKGFHSVKIHAKIGKSSWDTSLFPSKEGPYLLPLKASVRKAESIDAGDTVKVTCTLF